jgi:plastocyanin
MEERKMRAQRSAARSGFGRTRRLGLGTASAAVVAASLMAAPAGATDQMVEVSNNVFTPRNAPINLGETVTWTNVAGNHNVVFDDGTFTFPGPNGVPAPWMSQPRSFPNLGTFRYYCSEHGGPNGVGMSGTVTVSAPSPSPGPPPPGSGTPPPGGGQPGSGGGGNPGSGSGGNPGSGGDNPSPGGKSSTKVALQVSDATPDPGDRVRFFGTVRPAQDGRRVQLQRRTGGGSYRTVARIKLTDAGASRSKFSKRLRMLKDAVFRARLPADEAHAAGTSRRKRVNVL